MCATDNVVVPAWKNNSRLYLTPYLRKHVIGPCHHHFKDYVVAFKIGFEPFRSDGGNLRHANWQKNDGRWETETFKHLTADDGNGKCGSGASCEKRNKPTHTRHAKKKTAEQVFSAHLLALTYWAAWSFTSIFLRSFFFAFSLYLTWCPLTLCYFDSFRSLCIGWEIYATAGCDHQETVYGPAGENW